MSDIFLIAENKALQRKMATESGFAFLRQTAPGNVGRRFVVTGYFLRQPPVEDKAVAFGMSTPMGVRSIRLGMSYGEALNRKPGRQKQAVERSTACFLLNGTANSNPAFILFELGNTNAGSFKGGHNVVLAGVDDAGGDEHPAGFEELRDIRAEADDDIRNNVGADDVKRAVDLVGQISDKGGETVLHAVERSIFQRDFGGQLVNVHPDGQPCTEQKGSDGEDTAAAADVEHGVTGADGILKQLQTETGAGVGTGAEGHAGVEH